MSENLAVGESSAYDWKLLAHDGYPLADTVFRLVKGTAGRVVINNAIAIPRRFYRHFTTAMARDGYLNVS